MISIPGLKKIKDVAFLRLVLSDSNVNVLSRNVYWLATSNDKLEWNRSSWFSTPVSEWADFTALQNMKTASVSATATSASSTSMKVTLNNKSSVPAFFVRLNLLDGQGEDVTPVVWSDNYVTLWPKEKLELGVEWDSVAKGVQVEVCLLYTSPSPRDGLLSRMPSSA